MALIKFTCVLSVRDALLESCSCPSHFLSRRGDSGIPMGMCPPAAQCLQLPPSKQNQILYADSAATAAGLSTFTLAARAGCWNCVCIQKACASLKPPMLETPLAPLQRPTSENGRTSANMTVIASEDQ